MRLIFVAHVYEKMSKNEFNEICKFAREAECLLYANPERLMICVSSDGHEQVKIWMKSRKSVKKRADSQESDLVD
jgi:hypothetical protein